MTDWYGVCQFCEVEGERAKLLPFGNREGKVLFVIPGYLRLDDNAKKEYTDIYPQAYFVAFTACAGVANREKAELFCAVLLRNESLPFYKILISDYEPLKNLYGVEGESVTKEDGTTIAVYRGNPLDKSAREEYKRLMT